MLGNIGDGVLNCTVTWLRGRGSEGEGEGEGEGAGEGCF
jgi:hypothetical protein